MVKTPQAVKSAGSAIGGTAKSGWNIASTFVRGGSSAVAESGATNSEDTISAFGKSADALTLAKEIVADVKRMNSNARAHIAKNMTGKDQLDALAVLDKLDKQVADAVNEGFKPIADWVATTEKQMRAAIGSATS